MTAHGPVVCVIPGDLHLTEAGLENHCVARWMVDQVNDLVRPDFVQFIGDNVQDAQEDQFRLFAELAARLRVPWYAVVGDHDVRRDEGVGRFRARFGEPHGSLSLRGFRFLRLNTQEAWPVGLSAAQAAWFRAEVDAAEKAGERVVVFQHHYPFKVCETFDGPGLDHWRETVQTRRIEALFTGHTHYGQMANDGRNVVVATRSIGDPEGGPPGFTLAFLQGEDLAITYRTVTDGGPLVLITHPRDKLLATRPGHVVRHTDHIRARVWSIHRLLGVWAQVDDGACRGLEPVGNGDWAGLLDGEQLDKGEHRLLVRAEDETGAVGEQAITFVVDPTGRYTAVPGVRPVVQGTAFC